MKMHRRQVVTTASAIAIAITASAGASAQTMPGSTTPCESEHQVAGWNMTASLSPGEDRDNPVAAWQASKDFSTHFGLRIGYDMSARPTSYLQIWHNYKSGEFTLRLPNGSSFTTRLKANFAVTEGAASSDLMASLRNRPVRIEHTAHDGSWERYETDGLPEAIAAGEADLESLKEKRDNKECGAGKGWWNRLMGKP